MIVVIGNKSLKEISAEDFLKVVIIEGCITSLDFWGKPSIITVDNKMFSDTVCLDYESFRISDNKHSGMYTFFFDIKRLNFHYVRNDTGRSSKCIRIKIETIKFLIKQGYDIPIY